MNKNRIKMLIASLFAFGLIFTTSSCSGSKYYDGQVCGDARTEGTTFYNIRQYYIEQYVYNWNAPNTAEADLNEYAIYSDKYVYDQLNDQLLLVNDNAENYSEAHYLFAYYNDTKVQLYNNVAYEGDFTSKVASVISSNLEGENATKYTDMVQKAATKYYAKLASINNGDSSEADSNSETAHNGSSLTSVQSSLQSHSKACIVFQDGKTDAATKVINLPKTTWKAAWDTGLLTGLFVYPMAALVNVFVKLFGGLEGNGIAQMFAILVVTAVIKLAIFLCTFKSQSSTQKMQDIQPELLKLQAKYGQNPTPEQKQKMSMEMMALYKKYGVKPFAPFISLIVTFPIFIAMWRAVMYLAVLREGSLFGVIMGNNLSSYIIGDFKITALIIFILMAASQIITMKLPQILNRKRMTKEAKQQQKQASMMSNIMIIMILFMGFSMPVTMSIYWIASAIVSAIQTLIMHKVNNGGKNGHYKVKKDDNAPIDIPQGVKTK